MLDTLKTLLEVIDHIVKNFNFLEWRNDKRLSHIGSNLYCIMIAADETVATGWGILLAIESFIGKDRVKLVLDGKLPYTTYIPHIRRVISPNFRGGQMWG